ncbi:hypothetical protein Agub_g6294, partial [Astrephomene gubernaculifera]
MAPRLGGLLAFRYRLAKFGDAADEFLFSIFQGSNAVTPPSPFSQRGKSPSDGASISPSSPSSRPNSEGGPKPYGGGGFLGGSISDAYRRAREVYDAPLTDHMYITGPAMAPTLNRRGAKDAAARARLVLRMLRRPGPRNVLVGDVVAFHSPLAQRDDTTAVMVRRVAAVEGQEMVSSSETEPPFIIPPGHCWVMADNGSLRPEAGEVIDSRSYGHIPFSAVIGRVVYAASSSAGSGGEGKGRVMEEADHGPVRNSP